MQSRKISVLVALILSIAGTPSKSDTISLAFYYSTESFNYLGGVGTFGDVERTVFAESVVADMDLALTQSSLGQHDYEVAYISPAPFVLGGFTTPSIELYLDPAVVADRYAFAADVAIIITDDPAGPCGDASTPPSVSSNNDDQYAFVEYDFICVFGLEETAGHEMGHIFGARHEGESGAAKPYGHPQIDYVAQLQSIMATHPTVCGPVCDMRVQYSDPAKTFAGTSVVSGNTQIADVVRLIDDNNSFATVAGYRVPTPPPPSCHIVYEFTQCQGSSPLGQVTATLGGYTVTNADYDGLLSNGVWADMFEGALSCIGVSPSTVDRARAVLTTAYGISQCEVNIRNQSCGGPGGGPRGN